MFEPAAPIIERLLTEASGRPVYAGEILTALRDAGWHLVSGADITETPGERAQVGSIIRGSIYVDDKRLNNVRMVPQVALQTTRIMDLPRHERQVVGTILARELGKVVGLIE